MPDSEAFPEIRAAILQTNRLLELVRLPIRVDCHAASQPGAHDDWDLAGPAMLFSAANCLLSIRVLAEAPVARREQDAIVLLRRLYEHLVDFAWIAIDPATNLKKWVAEDYSYRVKSDNEFARMGEPCLEPANRSRFEDYVRTYGGMPDLLSRAEAADSHWSSRIAGHGTFPRPGEARTPVLGGDWSLRTFYATVYRIGSANAHPTPQSLRSYFGPGGTPGEFVIGLDSTNQLDRFSYTLAPLLYGAMLFIAEHVLGRPRAAEIEAAFPPS